MLRVAHILWETVSAADGDYDSNTIVRMRNNVMQVDVVWNVGDELINERDRLPERRKKVPSRFKRLWFYLFVGGYK